MVWEYQHFFPIIPGLKNTFQQNLSLDVTKVPRICRKNSTILSAALKSSKEGNWK